jgi:D-glycero-D-manno-heptose 1,7-bisphosphate phosphatase
MFMERAVFIDRDGVINESDGFITKKEQIKLIPNSARAISILGRMFKVFIITNQPSVGRGLCSEEEAKEVNKHLISLLEAEGARVDATYMCFHHPVHGQGKYLKECDCRKPKPGMILKAAKDFNIDLKKSFMIGDKTGDIKAGFLAGTKTVLVKTGYGGDDGYKDAVPDYVAEDLYQSINKILKEAL